MKKQHLLKSMLLLCALVVGSTSVWAQSGPDLTKFTWGEPIVDEDFSSCSTYSTTKEKHNPTATDYTKNGVFNGMYCNKDAASYGIESTVFSSNALFLTPSGTSPLIASVTDKTFGATGAFSFKITKASKGYIGFYAQINGTSIGHADASVYLYAEGTKLQISGGSSLKWQDVKTYGSETTEEICVIYNTTASNVTYGNSVSLPATSAHVYVNGDCVMDGASPKSFTITASPLTVFRVCAANSTTVNIDDVKIYSGLPTEAITISAATWASYSNANEVAIPSGLTAYYASSGNSTSVTLKEIAGGYIPANTGVVLHGTADTYYTTKTTTSASLGAENLLQPWLTAGTPTAGTYYILGANAGNPVFKESTGGTLAAGKSYLVLSGGAHELTIDIENGSETTGIQHVTSEKRATEGYFNLAGQRVAQPTKGLYIVNGKKVIIK
ncbi:MAG: hypothetical protein IJS06_03860 [Prevotella sp.]|nr:hypothetical protein [Prevotella sp.]